MEGTRTSVIASDISVGGDGGSGGCVAGGCVAGGVLDARNFATIAASFVRSIACDGDGWMLIVMGGDYRKVRIGS